SAPVISLVSTNSYRLPLTNIIVLHGTIGRSRGDSSAPLPARHHRLDRDRTSDPSPPSEPTGEAPVAPSRDRDSSARPPRDWAPGPFELGTSYGRQRLQTSTSPRRGASRIDSVATSSTRPRARCCP